MEFEAHIPRFTLAEELHRIAIKHTPGKLFMYDHFSKLANYTAHVPVFYTLMTPLFQIIYGSHNIHGGYFETGDEEWIDAQHNLTKLGGRAIRLGSEHRVLEVGSGIGGPAVVMAQNFGCHVTGLNITPAHVRRAQRHVRYNNMEHKVNFVIGNALHMPFREREFDHAYQIESISHMPNKAQVISEVARVTRPGARYFVIDACAERIDDLMADPGFNFFNVTWGVRAEEWARPGEIPDGMRQAGFKVVEERDLSPNLEKAPWVQADYARQRRKLIEDLYGEEVFDITLRALEIAGHYVAKRWFTYKLWVAEKQD